MPSHSSSSVVGALADGASAILSRLKLSQASQQGQKSIAGVGRHLPPPSSETFHLPMIQVSSSPLTCTVLDTMGYEKGSLCTPCFSLSSSIMQASSSPSRMDGHSLLGTTIVLFKPVRPPLRRSSTSPCPVPTSTLPTVPESKQSTKKYQILLAKPRTPDIAITRFIEQGIDAETTIRDGARILSDCLALGQRIFPHSMILFR